MAAPAVTTTYAGPIPPTKWWTRSFILVAALLGFIGLRIDLFIATATATDWLPDQQRQQRAEDLATDPNVNWCGEHLCPRLPESWIVIALVIGLVATVLVCIALVRARRYFVSTFPDKKTVETQLLGWLVWAVAVLGAAVLVFRGAYALGQDWAAAPLGAAAIVQFLSVVLSVFILARLASVGTEAKVDWSRAAATLKRQAPTLAIVTIFAAFVLFLPLTSTQVADALRALTATNALFVIAGSALLSMIVLDVWRAADKAAMRPRGDVPIPPWVLAIIGGAIAFDGALLLWSGLLGWGMLILGLIVLAFAVLELGRAKPAPAAVNPDDPAATSTLDLMPETTGGAAAGRVAAAVPLAALALAMFGAVVEMWITENPGWYELTIPIATAVVLGIGAVVVTRSPDPESGDVKPALRRFVDWFTLVGSIAVAVLLFSLPAEWELTALASALAAVIYGFHFWAVSRFNGEQIRLPLRLTRWCEEHPRAGWILTAVGYGVTILFAIGASFVVFLALHVRPLDASRMLGTIGLLDVFVAGLLAIGFYLSLVPLAWPSPRSLDFFGVKRFPVFSTLLVWWVVVGLVTVAVPNSLHDARLVPRDQTDQQASPTLAQAFATWRDAQVEFTPGTIPEDDETHLVPLVLVASHGGGIRAAYWTAVVLDCIVGANSTADDPDDGLVDDRDPEVARQGACHDDRRSASQARAAARRIFVASGVSGGAVGLAAYSQQMLTGDLHDGWINDRLSADLLAPVFGWGLFHDLGNHFAGLSPKSGGACRIAGPLPCVFQDRAAILEEALDAEVEGSSAMRLRATWDQRNSPDVALSNLAETVPLLVFNSSTTAETHRAVTSAANLSDWPAAPSFVTDADAASKHPVSDAADVSDALCLGQDLRISTAAVLAARFPYISPSGRIPGQCNGGGGGVSDPAGGVDCAASDICQLQLADGGYLENSGLMTIAEMLPTIEALVDAQNAQTPNVQIRVVVVDIDNDYRDELADPTVSPLVGESLLPAGIVLSGQDTMQNAAYGLVQKMLPSACFITIAPATQPGVQAPLGWILSNSTRRNLQAAVVLPAASAAGPEQDQQVARVQRLQSWLTPGGALSTPAFNLDDCKL